MGRGRPATSDMSDPILLILAIQELDKQIAEGKREDVSKALRIVTESLAKARIGGTVPGERAVHRMMYERAAARFRRRDMTPPDYLILPTDLKRCEEAELAKLSRRTIWSERTVRARFYKLCNKNSPEWKRLRPHIVDADAVERRLERYRRK